MEHAISRAYDILRLSPEQIIKLEVAEKNKGRCFYPSEIQECFRMPEIKITYCIPDLEASQNAHISRLRSEFYSKGLFPYFREIGALDVDLMHEFDAAVVTKDLDLVYSGSAKKQRLRDQVSAHWTDQ